MRQHLRFLGISLSLLAAAACSDTSTTPTSTRSFSADAPAFDFTAGGRFAFGDNRTSFTVTPAGGSFTINRLFTVNFSADAICDPSVSSYGEGTWDDACATLSKPITITASTRLSNGRVAVDFQPALRFSPSAFVTISSDLVSGTVRSNRHYFRANRTALSPLTMSYAKTLDGSSVADYLSDPSLVTHVDLNTGTVWRRVKHFSGYLMGSGESCEPSPDFPECIAVDGP
jgi:hypothetical protein